MKTSWMLVVALVVGACSQSSNQPPQQDMIVDAATRTAVLEAIILNLRQGYVFPEKVAAIEQGLRARQPEFDRITSADALADALTERLRELADGDLHLDVRYFEKKLPPDSTDDTPDPAEQLQSLRKNAGFEGVQRLRGNVGVLELGAFARPTAFKPKLAAAMALLADTGALIIDLRNCSGGDPDSVMLAASYFFDAPTHLNDVFWRDENRLETRWTDPNVAGPRYGQARPIAVLISDETASGCEDFAYAFKNAKRAVLLGEKTAGAAHAGAAKRLTDHFKFFLPSGLPINPVTHTDWEKVGVLPDVKVRPKKALDLAHAQLLKQLIVTEADPDWKVRLEHTLRDVE